MALTIICWPQRTITIRPQISSNDSSTRGGAVTCN